MNTNDLPNPQVCCSIVIRAYNEETHIGRLLEGIKHQAMVGVEVILVDSGSMDTTVLIAKQYGVKVVFIRPEEFTFGRSLNRGIAVAKGQIVVIASAHIYPVYIDWLERLLEPFNDPTVALTYGKQRGDERTNFSEQQIFSHWFPDQSEDRQNHPFCNNANAAIRRSIWEKHPFDESLTGLEDLSWAEWVLGHDYGIAYVAEAEIIHCHNERPRDIHNRYRREAMAFKQLHPEAHFSLYDMVRMTTANITSDLLQATRQHLLWKSFSSIYWFRTMQFWGTYQGYRQTPGWTWQLRQTFYYPHQLAKPNRSSPRDIKQIHYKD